MPYIKAEDRNLFEPFLNDLLGCFNEKEFTPGDLNYLMTRLAHEYLVMHGKSYSVLNDIVGAYECSKMELYRRVAAPYEDEKITQNTDVMPDFRNEI